MTTTFPEDFQILDINPEQDEKDAVALFEKETEKPLYPAQSERISISVFTKIFSLFKIQVNEAFKNLLLPYAKGIFLDIIGALLGCPRLKASQAVCIILIKLYEIFTFDKVIPKGTEIETKDGEYIFTTDEDITIKAGELTAQVGITSVKAGSALNYKKGEITNIIQNFEYVESVTNITDAEGGSDEEEDDAYRERLYIAAEKSSTAGPELAYKYYAMSADKSITDVQVECKQENASITYNEQTYTEQNKKIENDDISAIINYTTGIFKITLKKQSIILEVKIPPCARVDIYALTESGTPSENIIQKIYNEVNPEDRRPLSDLVVVSGAEKQTYKIKATVIIEKSAIFDDVQKNVLSALNEYIQAKQKLLKQEILPSDIITLIKNVSGVYDVELESPAKLPASINVYYAGTIDDISFKRMQ